MVKRKTACRRLGRPKPKFVHTSVKNFISEATILLVSFGEKTSALGSGVIIGPRMALTARHVVEEFVHIATVVRPSRLEGNTRIDLRAIHWVDKGSRIQQWRVRKVYCGPTLAATDLAVLLLEPLTEEQLLYKWKRPFVQLLPPKIGSQIATFGYHSMTVTENSEGVERINYNPYTSIGTVEEIHHATRDRSQLSFPCFRTNARFDGGMSGAPVFSDMGFLCGIVCSNMPPEAPGGEHISYVSVLWPMMGIHVDYTSPGEEPTLHPLVVLARLKLLLPIDLDKVMPSLTMLAVSQMLAQQLAMKGYKVGILAPAPERDSEGS